MASVLALLLGVEAGSLQNEFTETAAIPQAGRRIAVGLPVDVVRQRPDIRAAERRLAAQTAAIGIATANLYPTFSLNGFVDLQAQSSDNLFSGNADTWGLSLPANWNIFSGGRVRNNIILQEELTEQRLLAYQQTVLKALAEVENSLQAYNQERKKLAALESATEATLEAVHLALVKYNAGLTEYTTVMIMQRDFYQLQDDVVSSKARVVLDLIGLYKAVGGGWQ